MTRIPCIAAALSSLLLISGLAWGAPEGDIIGAPGVIPHPGESYLPITIEKNMCVACHRPATATPAKKGEIPLTHFANGKLAGERYECTLCHAPSSTASELAPVDPNAALH